MEKTGKAVGVKEVQVTGGFWKQRMEINRSVTLPAEYEQLKESGRVDSIKCLYDAEKDNHPQGGIFTIDGVLAENMASEGRVPRPHHYWDSDLAKWIEAASYALMHEPDAETEERIDAIVADFAKLQEEDGYLNTYYTVVEPGKRWTNVYRMHELYCAGHLIEAAVAYYEATGKREFLEIVCRYADLIDRTFGAEEGKIHGYPGHQEIELALVKLYRLTKEKRYLNLAVYFIDERGKQPYFFEQEAVKNGRDVEDGGPKGILGKSYMSAGPYALFQSHLPVRQQKTAEGHAVRLTYMASAMADLALETGDEGLWKACRDLWNNVTQRRMYVTGGVGAQDGCESFQFDYQLPNEEAYQETCASIGMVMWAYRMLVGEPDRIYADVMERALYNGVISGVSLQGDRFFYANHLAVKPEVFSGRVMRNPRMLPYRQQWFPVSCCPMNLARLTESVGGYIYSCSQNTAWVHLFIQSETEIELAEGSLHIRMETDYPKSGCVRLYVRADKPVEAAVAFRNPSWSSGTQVTIDGMNLRDKAGENGYYRVMRKWGAEETEISIVLDMRPKLIESHPYVRMNAGKAAVLAGPFIYCIEEEDNGANLETVFLDSACRLETTFKKDLLGGVNIVDIDAWRKTDEEWEGQLYRPLSPKWSRTKIRAVPYYCFANRGRGEMLVWMNIRNG